MPYPEALIAPMRQELVQLGFQELKTPDEVDEVLGTERRTTVVAINSVCGCSAGGMRPGVAASLATKPNPTFSYPSSLDRISTRPNGLGSTSPGTRRRRPP